MGSRSLNMPIVKQIAGWLADAAFETARALGDKLGAFRRKLTPREQQDQLEEWNRNHMPSLITGACVVCDMPGAKDTEHCPGPVLGRKKRKP